MIVKRNRTEEKMPRAEEECLEIKIGKVSAGILMYSIDRDLFSNDTI